MMEARAPYPKLLSTIERLAGSFLAGRSGVALVAVFFFFADVSGGSARADNWPAWRNDGSGVSHEKGIPLSWGTEQHVRWKTRLEGKGLSSPVVWDDRVFLTTVVDGSTRHTAFQLAVAVIAALMLVTLFWYADGKNRAFLAGISALPAQGAPLRRWSSRLLLIGTFIGVAYAALVACDQLRRSYPEITTRLLGRSWRFREVNDNQLIMLPAVWPWGNESVVGTGGPKRYTTQIPFDCFIAGFVGAAAVYGLGRWLGNPVRATATGERTGGWHLLLGPLWTLWVGGMAGSFLVAVHGYLMADPPYLGARTWFQCADICLLGLVAALGALPRRSIWSLLGCILGVAILILITWGGSAGVPAAKWWNHVRSARLQVYGLVVIVTCAGLICLYFFSRNGGTSRAFGKSAFLGAVPLLLASGIFFGTLNYLLPQAAVLLQVVCVDRASGAIRWQTPCAAYDAAKTTHLANSFATPTPVTDGQHVYVHFGGNGAYCLDFDGRVVWGHADPLAASHWGAASSPILWNALLILTYDVETRSLTQALDKMTGQVRWEADRTPLIETSYPLDAYSTPICLRLNGGEQLVHHACNYLCAYDLGGREIWCWRSPGAQVVASPVVCKDLIMVGGGDRGKCLAAVQLIYHSGQVEAEEVWQAKRYLPDLASPVVWEDHIYAITRLGIASCHEAATGKLKWVERLPGEYHSSITAADGKLFLCNTDGVTTVLAAGPQYRVLATNVINEAVQSSFAVSDRELFIRGEKHIFCIVP